MISKISKVSKVSKISKIRKRMITKKPFILTSIGIGLLLAWNVVSGLLSQINWGGVTGCVVGYQAGDWLTNLMGNW
jgi:hypothetical protein